MNVLIIMTDQQRTDTIGACTPNINKLAEQSLSFDCYAQSPQCQPARAAFWTGRYPSTLRMWWNEMELAKTEQTLANMLRDVQYETAYFGKWHLDRTTHTLGHFGFDPQNSYLSEDWREGKDLPGRDAGVARREYLEIMKTTSWAAKLSSRLYQHEDVISERAVRFMSNCKRPFLCAIGFRGPHPPYASPPPFCGMYDPDSFSAPDGIETYEGTKLTPEDWRMIKSQYYGCVSWIDDNVGRIMDFVDRKARDTIVVFTSDHGDMLGDHGCFSKGLYAYEQVVSVPLIVRIPGWGPRRCYGLHEHIDVVPTILEMLEQEIGPGIQGKSLTHIDFTRCALSMVGYKPRLKMVRNSRFKYWICGDDEFLFDLESDPGETVNRADSMPRVIAKMRQNLVNCLIAAEDPLPVPEL